MKNFFKGKFGTIIILFFTLILAGVAIFTALRLYQLRSTSVAPNVPSSIPRAQEVTPGPCTLSFTLNTSTASPTATGTPTATPTETPTATPTGSPTATPNLCGGTCGSNINCGEGLYCYTTVGFCRNPSCPTQADCNCPGTSTPSPTPGHTGTPRPTASPTPTAPTLPVSGTDWPTILSAGIGLFVIIGSLLLAI